MIIKAFKNWLNRRAQKRSELMKKRIDKLRHLSARLVANQIIIEQMIDCGIRKESYAIKASELVSKNIALDMVHIAKTMYFSNDAARSAMKHELISVIYKVEREIGRPITDKAEVMKMLHNL